MTYKFFDFAKEVLNSFEIPLTFQEIWSKGEELGCVNKLQSKGKTPWATLGARLYMDVRDNPKSDFIKIGNRPARFFLKDKESKLSQSTNLAQWIKKSEIKEEKKQQKATSLYTERDLHKLLAYFSYANLNVGRPVYTKTIFHERSTKKQGYSEWLHPDMVGFYFPLAEDSKKSMSGDWNADVLEFGRLVNTDLIRIYSFELKKSINNGNYRESFFQTVSNSTWANERYLVAADINKDEYLLSELERLSTAFGVGIIELDLKSIDESRVLYPSKYNPNLDWEQMNKLASINSDFESFLKSIKIDYSSQRIVKSEYDKVDDPESLSEIFKKKLSVPPSV